MSVGSLKYRAGLAFILLVVVIWVTSAEVTQLIFSKYRHPFILTWLGASLLVIYLPLSFLKDYLTSFILQSSYFSFLSSRKDAKDSSSTPHATSINHRPPPPPSSHVKSPRLAQRHEIELQGRSLSTDSDDSVEEGKHLLPRENGSAFSESNELTHGKLMKMAMVLAPLWLLTEYLSNASLSLTSVASTTILSSTSGLFTLLFGVSMGQDTLTAAKVIAVFISISGVVMTELGKTSAADDDVPIPKGNHSLTSHFVIGDLLGLSSAITYGIYTILLKKYAGDEEKADIQKIFGYVGLVTFFGLWWIAIPLIFLGLEPPFKLPNSVGLDEDILANSLIGSVASDYFWALSVVWTTPLVATLGLSLTIPLAMVADVIMHGRTYSAVYVLGSLQVFGGFLIANLADRCTKRTNSIEL